MILNGSQIIIECLKEQGVDTVFGYPGGAILNVYDALYKHSDEITHILTSHEQGASHMADGYARATGKVGVCLATSGPGATNLATGIATVDGVERFDGETHPHVHFICSECGAIMDLHDVEAPASLTHTAEVCSGGQVTGCQLSFTGICPTCLRKQETA